MVKKMMLGGFIVSLLISFFMSFLCLYMIITTSDTSSFSNYALYGIYFIIVFFFNMIVTVISVVTSTFINNNKISSIVFNSLGIVITFTLYKIFDDPSFMMLFFSFPIFTIMTVALNKK